MSGELGNSGDVVSDGACHCAATYTDIVGARAGCWGGGSGPGGKLLFWHARTVGQGGRGRGEDRSETETERGSESHRSQPTAYTSLGLFRTGRLPPRLFLSLFTLPSCCLLAAGHVRRIHCP